MSSSETGRRSERRATRRIDLGIEVKVWRGETTVAVGSQNVSAGGIKLVFTAGAIEPPFAAGERLDLEFELPLLPDVVITKGDVRWVAEDSCGVQFTALHPRVVSAINRLHARG